MLSRALFDEFRVRIIDGTYAAGMVLPSTRALAAERGISRATVCWVYEQLAADGFIDTRPGKVARVALDIAYLAGQTSSTLSRDSSVHNRHLSQIGQRLLKMAKACPQPLGQAEIDFVYGPLSGADFPRSAWLQAQRQIERQQQHRLAYEDPRGSTALRKALQTHLNQTRGLVCSLDQLMIVNGSQQALDLCARLLIDPGDAVAVENPGYRMAHQVFEAYGAQLAFMELDQHGVVTDQLTHHNGIKLAYVTPTHQFPLGAFMSIQRRHALLDWIAHNGTWLIEDDYDSEYRYTVRPEATLHSLDTHGRVIHIGTFSKTLSPQLRLGYMVLPMALVDIFVTAKRLGDRHNASNTQEVVAKLLQNGSYARHVRRIRRIQHERQRMLLLALEAHFQTRINVQGAASGLHVVVWFHTLPSCFEDALAAAALQRGVQVYPLSSAFHPESASAHQARSSGLIMGYALLDIAQIKDGVARLAAALKEVEAAMHSIQSPPSTQLKDACTESLDS